MAAAITCPKCGSPMHEQSVNGVTIDRCEGCGGLWFDHGEAEALAEDWIVAYIDRAGDTTAGRLDEIDTIDCPRCGDTMARHVRLEQALWFEQCERHGTYLDAGEFTAWVAGQYL